MVDLHIRMVVILIVLLWFVYDWKSPQIEDYGIMWMNLQSLTRWASRRNYVNEFAKSGSLGEPTKSIAGRWLWTNMCTCCGQSTAGRWLIESVNCRALTDCDGDYGWLVCNVYGSGTLPYVVMHLDGQLNITTFWIISSEFSLYDMEPDFING
jgi:hypothetical protein